ncbi:sensor histidine kinase KdpD [Acidithiobacillus sp. CV18-2]|nr:sensor histidine kinase KdpD [Acidithiobacillus sp. CV18-3]MBU2757984.1 sensor histidine kinase KdpD [Acidithiobacillus sp. BN09-2]MBU2776642.1 sensor histidine kinase KdpD [Acidithiobacillus sp. CV18-2]MBU2798655.1 sensor histidine kinase KdpD [Acidithiobacillus sp. VAN18-4]UTV82060.1 sensor histidine kinase KdpD [Acidithiobacillus sp. YTS05]
MADDTDKRPDPDALLAVAQKEEASKHRGRLKIFFGAAPGVGKTYAMLRYGQEETNKGRDVVIGIVETHQRSDTQALADTLPQLPLRSIQHRNVTLEEFDLDAALTRRPGLLLLDELAHSNAPGSRHQKRWQDLEELLEAGINVATTVNVQHLESVNEVVQAIAGVRVRETVPDRIIEEAEELTLVDISDADLLQRLKDGKVYLGERGARAMANFFRRGNLIALRQLAMRVAADRVDLELRQFRAENAESESVGLRERLLVAIGMNADDEHLVRAGYRLATAMRCPWIVVHVDTVKGLLEDAQAQAWLWSNLHLAERLGAETVRLTGVDVVAEILAYAKLREVTQVLIGQSQGMRRYLWWWPGSLLGRLLSHKRPIGLTIHPLPTRKDVSKDSQERSRQYLGMVRSEKQRRQQKQALAIGVAAGVGMSLLGLGISALVGLPGLFLLYLVGAVVIALYFGRWPSVAALLSALASFYVFGLSRGLTATLGSLLSFAVIIGVAVLISQLVARSKEQESMARMRERRVRNLYTLVRALSRVHTIAEVLSTAAEQIHSTLGITVSFWLPAGNDAALPLQFFPPDQDPGTHREALNSAAVWVFQHRRSAGMGTDTLSSLPALLLPMVNNEQPLGVLLVSDLEIQRTPVDWFRYLETITRLIAAALETARTAEIRSEADLRLQVERMQSALLGAVSHDLRTPLTTILGSLSTLDHLQDKLSEAEQRALILDIYGQTQRMSENIERILRVAALLSGGTELKKEWVPLTEIVGNARRERQALCEGRPFTVQIPKDFPLLYGDPVLLTQVYSNLLENACKYTPAGSAIEMDARADEREIFLCVADNGHGIPPGREEQIFERFSQVKPPVGTGGSGLGLALVKSIVQLHGGRVWVINRLSNGGARFCFTLPRVAPPPPPKEG